MDRTESSWDDTACTRLPIAEGSVGLELLLAGGDEDGEADSTPGPETEDDDDIFPVDKLKSLRLGTLNWKSPSVYSGVRLVCYSMLVLLLVCMLMYVCILIRCVCMLDQSRLD